MKKFVNNWYYISVYLAVAVAVIAIFAPVGILQKILLGSISVILLHFFEEFGFPGGFPLMGMQIMMHSDERDSTKWNCNNLSSMFGNWVFLLLIYILPLAFPRIRFLTLAALFFNFLELFMHLVLFNAARKTFYNPGLVTAIFGLTPIACYYFIKVFNANSFLWYDYVIAVIWMILVFLFSFRSPLYWYLGKKEGYPLTEQSAFGIGNIKKQV
jgi:hypothetical protein